jgi:hypothetical protein
MKKSILSPLCSAFVIPGLGQIINRDLKKGLFILGVVFLLFVGGAVKLAFIIKSLATHPEITRHQPGAIMERLQRMDFSPLLVLIIAFAVVWFYSVLDAFWTGKKRDSEEEGNHL